MSRNTTAAHRIALLASSSLGLAAIASAASLGVALMPTVALAYDECLPANAATLSDGPGGVSDPTLNGPVVDSFSCPGGTTTAGTLYNPGITYTAAGDGILGTTDLTVVTTGTISVGTTNTGTVAERGINLNATGNDSILWNSQVGSASTTDGRITGGNFVNGPVIDASSDAGNITIRTDLVSGSSSSSTAETNATHAIRAVSGAGDIVIEATGSLLGGGTSGATPQGFAGVEARSTGGGDVSIAANFVEGRLYGVYATTTGAGALTVSTTGNIQPAFGAAAVGIAGLYARTGSGPMSVSGSYWSGSGNSHAIVADAGGDVQMNLNDVRLRLATDRGIRLTTVGGSTSVINVSGEWGRGSGNNQGELLRLDGDGDLTVNVTGEMGGGLQLADYSGAFSLNVASAAEWHASVGSNFSAGDDTVTIAEGGRFAATATSGGAPLILEFGDGEDLFRNRGVMLIAPREFVLNPTDRTLLAYELRMEGLETFENAGRILLGGFRNFETDASDGWYDDVLLIPGAHFVGLDGSEILMDVNFGGTGQTACDPALRNDDGDMPAADCVGIIGGSTEGVTQLAINDLFPGDRGGYSPDGIVLIDVSGGESASGHFVMSPNSSNYSSANGGIIDKGMFFYTVIYDAENQQHKLVGLPGANAVQFPAIAQAGHALWRTSTAGWLNRQADMRSSGLVSSGGGGVWGRVATEFADRDLIQSIENAGNVIEFDNTYRQDSYAVTGGFDVLSAASDTAAAVAGVMLGYASSELNYSASPNHTQFDGWTGGVYASILSGGLFVDAAVNANRLILKQDVPTLGLLPEGTILDTNLLTVGAQVEAGYRVPVLGAGFVEPLAGVTYVRSTYDDLAISNSDAARPGIDVAFDDPTSLRAGVGLRAGMDQDYGAWRAQFSVLGRVWEEFEDDTAVVLRNTGPDALLSDDFSGQFTEFGVGVSVHGLNDALSGFFNFGGEFADDYQSQNVAAGVRVNW